MVEKENVFRQGELHLKLREQDVRPETDKLLWTARPGSSSDSDGRVLPVAGCAPCGDEPEPLHDICGDYDSDAGGGGYSPL